SPKCEPGRPRRNAHLLWSVTAGHRAVLRWLIAISSKLVGMTMSTQQSAFTGFRFPRDVIAVAVRWYLRYGLSYRDVEELLAERGVEVDHTTVYRWVQTFTPEFIDAARPARHATGDRWFVDETYVKGRRPLDLPLPRDRPTRSRHRRPGLPAPRRCGCAGVLHSSAHRRPRSGRDHDRPRTGLPARDRRVRPSSAARL